MSHEDGSNSQVIIKITIVYDGRIEDLGIGTDNLVYLVRYHAGRSSILRVH